MYEENSMQKGGGGDMNGIHIGLKSAEAEDSTRHPVTEYVFLAAGVFGFLLFFQSIEGITFSSWAVYPLAAVMCGIAWILSCRRRKAFFLFASACIAVCIVAVFRMEDVFRRQIGYIINCVTEGSAAETIPVTETALLAAMLLVLFIVLSEILLKSHEVLFVLIMLLILASPVMGIKAGFGAILLLALFLFTFGVIQEDLPFGVKEKSEAIKKGHLQARSGTIVGVILLGLIPVIVPVLLVCSEGAYHCVYTIEGQVHISFRQLLGRAAEPVTGGRISRGNNYPTGTVHLRLEASEKPGETLYLRGFSGGEYVGGGWRSADDDILLTDIMIQQSWEDMADVMDTRFKGMYFIMNANMQTEHPPHAISLKLWHSGGEYNNMYVPYYSQRSRIYYHEQLEDIWHDYGFGNTREGYLYQYYEQSDMNIDWDNVATTFWFERDWFMEMQEAYMKEIQTVYTRVPTGILPRLTEMCRAHPMEGLDEITSFILHTLDSNAVYTLTPGWAPQNEDIVEYFLFKGGRGYCEHFAAAATLMYRLYGIPARYAAGYMVLPEDFTEQEQGVWTASVTDEDAHAWPEIFLADYGWTPVEVTLAGGGEISAVYPGFDTEALGQRGYYDWEAEEAGIPEEAGHKAQGSRSYWWEDLDFEFVSEENRQWFYALGICVLYSLCMLPFFFDYRRLRRIRKLEQAGCRSVFSRLLQMLQFGGILKEYDGTEEDFAAALGQALPVPMEDIARMQAIVSQAAFGIKETEQQEEEYVRSMYLRLARAVYGTLKGHKKIIFRYWKAFY